MIDKNNRFQQTSALCRSSAKERLPDPWGQAPEYLDPLQPEEIRLRFHQLCVHQNELERQNGELHRVQEELESMRARYFDLYHKTPAGLCTLSSTGLILEANLAAAILLGAPRDALVKQPFSSFIHQEDQEILGLHCQQNLATGETKGCELRMVKQDRTLFWARLDTTAAPQAGGAVEYHLLIRDISNRKRAEEALRRSEQQATEAKNLLKLILDTIPVRLFWKDLQSVFLGCNLLFAQDAGYQVPEELIGLDDYAMGWREEAAMYRRDDLAVMNSGQPRLRYEEVQTTPEGKQIWLSTSKVPLRDADGKIIGILGAYEDITEQKLAKEELLKAQNLESLGLLAGGIAHDFNNYLMVIMGNISFAKMLVPPEDKAYERLSIAETASLKAKGLTQQFLTFSKGGAPVKSVLSAAHLIRSYGSFALSGKKSACEYSFSEDLWKIEADEGQIGQVITNLLINADQSMEESGIIRVDGENVVVTKDHGLPLPDGNYLKISITDQGAGIPEEYLGRIFDPYFTTKKTGRGLGLASAYSIMKRHGGSIAVESAAGSGTTFTLFLPAVVSEGAAPTVEEPELPDGGGKILVMDDDELVLQIVGGILENLGYEVAHARDGRADVAMYADARQSAKPFDAVILDLTVPGGMGGKEAIRQLLTIDPQAKAIVSSGYRNDPVMTEYTRYGFRGVIAKPYCPEELRKQMQQVLRS